MHGQQRVPIRDVAHLHTVELALLEPGEVGLAVRCIDDQEKALRRTLVRNQVVDDPALVVRQQRVLRLAGADPVEVVREQRLQEVTRPRAFDFELAHVRDVEDPAVAAHREVLRDDAFVLHRHLPARERDESRAERDVAVEERRSQQRLHRALMLKARARLA